MCIRDRKPEPHGKRGEIVQPETAVRLRAMQEQCDTNVRDMACYHDEENGHPPSSCPYAKTWHCLTPEKQRGAIDRASKSNGPRDALLYRRFPYTGDTLSWLGRAFCFRGTASSAIYDWLLVASRRRPPN